MESAFGSQPICTTFFPSIASAADRLLVVVDLPMPPFPYIAIFFILSCSFFCHFQRTVPRLPVIHELKSEPMKRGI